MELKTSLNRFLSILFIVALGVAFFSGIQSSAPDMRMTGDYYFDESSLMDLRVISTLGITQGDLDALGKVEGVARVQGGYMEDVYCGEGEARDVLHVESLSDGLNTLDVAEGRLPQEAGECFLDASYAEKVGYRPGDTLQIAVSSEEDSSLKRRSFTVSGCGHSPCYISFNRGSTSLGTGSLSGFIYVLPEEFDAEVYSVAYLQVEDARERLAFTDDYDDLIDTVCSRVEGIEEERCEIRYDEVMETAESELAEAKQEVADGKRELADARKELEDGKAEAESELADAKAELEDGEKELADGKKELAEGKQEAADGERELKDGERELADSEAELEDGRQQIAQAQETLDSGEAEYQSGLNAYSAQEADAKKKLDLAQKELDKGKDELEEGRAQYEENLAQIEAGEQAFAAAQKELTAQQEAYDQGAAQVAEGRAQYEEGMQQAASGLKAYQEAAAGLAARQQEYDAAIGALRTAADTARQAQQECDAQVEQGRPGYEEAQAGLPGAQEYLAQLQAALGSMQEDTPEYAQALAGVQAQDGVVAELRQRMEAFEALLARQQQLQEAAAAAESLLNTKTEELSGVKAELDAAAGTLAAQKQTLDATSAALAEAKQELDAHEAELAAAAPQLAAGWSQLAQEEKTLMAGKEQLAAAQETLAASQKQIDEGQAEIDAGYRELDKELKKARAQLSSARQELDSGWAQLHASQSQMSEGEKQLDEGRKQLADARSALADARKEIADGEKEIADNEQKLKDGWEEYREGKQTADREVADGEREIEDAEREIEDAERKITDAEAEIADIRYPEWYVDDRSALPEHTGFGENAERLSNIAKVVPILFFLVAALVSLTTMTRMVEEQRTQIGTLKALGYGKAAIVSKYLKYAFWATVGGSVLGVLIGEKIFPWVIINAYGIMYHDLPKILIPYNWTYALIAVAAALLCTIGAALLSCYKELLAVPAQLMRPPAPKEGKRVWMEYLPVIWRRLSFTWKSTVRNLFRYKKRFLMTVIGIGGCMGLLLVGYGLQDSIMDIGRLQYDELQLYDAMVVLDTDAKEHELRAVDEMVGADGRIDQSKHFLMQMQDLQTRGRSGKEWSVYVVVPEDLEDLDAFLRFRDRETGEPYELTDEGAILTEKLADELGTEPGDTIVLRRDGADDVEVPIQAVCENYLSHYLYLTPALYERLYGEKPVYNTVFFASAQEQSVIEEIGGDLLAGDAVLNVTYTGTMAEQIDNMLGALDVVMVVLIVSAGMLAFVVLYNLNNININERRRELATLKVLGFYNTEVAAYVYRENILLTLIGAALGVVLGKLLHAYVITTVEVDACMFGRNINFSSFVYGTLFTIGFSVIVNGVMYFKLKKIDMVESLKSVE